ncbi:MAG: hypothetical protein K2M19_07960 [Muribaculaceae bacterium]|nr:hypothetical protein [Muribaculaceae bacterium]
MSQATSRRIARNSLYLYLRMLVTLFVSLYTSRVMLQVLGVRDYGVYNVVGGMVVILSFLNGTMSGTTQRFLNFEMGRAAEGQLKRTFEAAFSIHLCVSAILFILGETVGLWFVNTQLVILPERIVAANWAYQFALLGGVCTIMQVPFTGAILAHEHMNAYAYINLAFTFLKLGVTVALLYIGAIDTLIIYAALIFAVTVLTTWLFARYCHTHFIECRMNFSWHKNEIKDMLRYSLSDLIGTTCYTVENQGVIVILNRIGGTILNAAGGLSVTVGNALFQFGTSIIMAFRPQIIQQYAAGNYTYMQTLLVNCSKFSILLMGMFAIPAFAEMDYLLNIWLTDVPPYTADFCRISLIALLSMLTLQTLNAAMHATGKIFIFSLITGLSYLLELPVMYYLMRQTGNPRWAYYVPIFQLSMCVFIVAGMFKYRLPQFKAWNFLINGYFAPWALVITLGYLITWFQKYLCGQGFGESFVQLIVIGLLSVLSVCSIAWLVLLPAEVCCQIRNTIRNRFNRHKN